MDLESKIADQISEWTDDKVMFTAYDVTIALRNSGERVEHNDVRKIVHRLYSDQDFDPSYQKVMTRIPSTNENAFLFHHINSSTLDYEPLAVTYSACSAANSGAQTKTQPQVASKTPTAARTSNRQALRVALGIRSGIRNKQPVNGVLNCAYPKHDGSLTIPSKLLIDSGLKNKQVFVESASDVVIIKANGIADGISSWDKMPKPDGVLLIPLKMLKPLAKNIYAISLSSDGKEIHVR